MAAQTMANERFEMFKSQDLENDYFDLKFEVEGKRIYAHKVMLGSVSDVFKRMISDVWNKKEFIEISTNSYDDFYEFLTFLYSGKCKINDENIFTMVDLSEFYHIRALQQRCDQYLCRKEYTSENVLFFLEASSNYSLPMFEKILSTLQERINFFECEGFLELSKDTIKKIISFGDRFVSEEKIFKKVYQWADNRAVKKREESIDENFNMNDAIKTEIMEFLPYIHFKKMNLEFLREFVAKRSFLFTFDELSDILENANPDVKVKVTDAYGKSIYCWLPSKSDVVKNVQTLKNCPALNSRHQIYWETKFPIPLTPRKFTKRYGNEWYLIYLDDGRICVTHHSRIKESYYVIAEMIEETFFNRTTANCKIEIE